MSIMGTIKDMVAWSSKRGEPCDMSGAIPRTVCRNWRTWMGHSNVADIATAIAAIPLLFTTATWAVVVGVVGWLAIVAFYFNKEFNPKTGNFFDENTEKDHNDKTTDSVLDFVVPLFTSTFLKFSFGPLVLIGVTALQTVVTYLIYTMETD